MKESDKSLDHLTIRAIRSSLLGILIMAALLFLPAGTLDYWQALIFMAVPVLVWRLLGGKVFEEEFARIYAVHSKNAISSGAVCLVRVSFIECGTIFPRLKNGPKLSSLFPLNQKFQIKKISETWDHKDKL
jgi:hypothetical protein